MATTNDRWFTPDELHEMSRPTMDRAIEAIDNGDTETARRLCEAMKHEWRALHDLMVEGIAGLISYIAESQGESAVEDAWRYGNERTWKDDVEKIVSYPRREIVKALAATWRAHSTSGVGPKPGAFTITEDHEKFTFSMNPCGSGQRLVQRGKYEGETGFRTTDEAHTWSYGRKDFPLYCTHCAFMNEVQPIEWLGFPIYPSDPPDDYGKDPCVWYWYKDPADIPARHWERHGLRKSRA